VLPARPPRGRGDDGISLVELVVASLLFVVVTAAAGPLIVRMARAQTTIGKWDAQVTSTNDATEQMLSLGCGATLATGGTVTVRTSLVNRTASCVSLAGAGATAAALGTVTVSSGDLRATAGTSTLDLRTSWTDPSLTRTSWLPAGVDGTVAANVVANAPRTPGLVLQRTVTQTTTVDRSPRTRTLTHLASRSDAEVPAGALGRLEVIVPAGWTRVAVQYRTVGGGGPSPEPLWLVRQTLNLDDSSGSATLAGGSGRRVAAFPYVPGGAGVSYSVKAINAAGAETSVNTCSVPNTGDPTTGGDINVCYVS
jgi:hypothetical protein